MQKIFLLWLALFGASCYSIAQNPKLTGAFASALGIVVDSKNNVYVTGRSNKLIKIDPSGKAISFAGSPSGFSGRKDGKGPVARFSDTKGIAIDGADNLYIVDDNRIRKVTPDGFVSTVAGNDKFVVSDGNIAEASFHRPEYITVDNNGNIYVTDKGFDQVKQANYNVIRKITPQGNVTTLKNAPGDNDAFRSPWIRGLVCDKENNLYVCALGTSSCIKKISPAGVITNVTGICNAPKITAVFKEGDVKTAQIVCPTGIAINKQGELFFSDARLHRIVRVAQGKVTTVAGNSKITTSNSAGGAIPGYSDGNARQALFESPYGIAFDASGNLYIVDRANTVNSYIRKLTPDGIVTTFCKHEWNPKTSQYEEAD